MFIYHSGYSFFLLLLLWANKPHCILETAYQIHLMMHPTMLKKIIKDTLDKAVLFTRYLAKWQNGGMWNNFDY